MKFQKNYAVDQKHVDAPVNWLKKDLVFNVSEDRTSIYAVATVAN
jgi:hypothetical protein